MKIEKAVRKAIPFIGCFYGKSGSGKTYSALKLANGIANGGKICLIDTENGRASHYADEFNFDVINLEPPFSPTRYLEAIKLAEESQYSVLVIDSISHEWEGIGGCLELADEGKTATGKSLTGLNKWAKVKMEHRKLMQRLLQAKIHIIFCARAKDLLEQEGSGANATITHKGIIPIQEKNFPFEMLVTFFMQDSGKVTIEKCIKGLQVELKFSPNEYISEKHGKVILDWINKGSSVNFRIKELRTEGMEIAMSGNSDLLLKGFTGLNMKDKLLVKDNGLNEELKNIVVNYSQTLNSTEESTITENEVKELQTLIDKTNQSAMDICELYNVNALQELPKSDFEILKKSLQNDTQKTHTALTI